MPLPHQVYKCDAFYKDISRDPQDGDEYFQLFAEYVENGYALYVIRGVKGGEPKTAGPYEFATRAELRKAWTKHQFEAYDQGFKPALPI